MQNIVQKIVAIVLILAFCVWVLSYKKIRLGKDLQGGTSLIYLVNIPEDTPDKQKLIEQTIEVLKDRINPKGVLDISMQPLGVDRIEIVMPLPKDEVLDLRKTYETALAALIKNAEIDEDLLEESLQFNRTVEEFAREAPEERRNDFLELQVAFNNLQVARQELAEASSEDKSSEEFNRLAQRVADLQNDFEILRDAILQTSLERARVVRTLNLPTDREKLRDENNRPILDEDGNPVTLDSQREIALAAMKNDFPHLAMQLDEVVTSHDEYQRNRTTLDDPEDLMRLLRGAGVLEYFIAVREATAEGVNVQELRDQLAEFGPDNIDSSVAQWFPINDVRQWYDRPEELAILESNPEGFFRDRLGLVAAEHEGNYYILLYITRSKSITHRPETPWTVEATGITADQFGRPAVSFTLDPAGGSLMSRLTGAHQQQPMAIVLDGQVYSAPNINDQIGQRGIIMGDFSQSELDYLTRVLAAGALEARLSHDPIAINTLGPSLGRDNLERGKLACIYSIIATALVMVVYYFFAGFVACFALLANAIFIFGVMALIDGTFTLPGLAGIALSIGMAVDANVLVYERIREEIINNKEDLRSAIRLGYQKALSAIIDGNLTNLIVCLVLFNTATTEVKGFALTLAIGIFGTLFTALFVTRQVYYLYTDFLKLRFLPMLPTVVPAIHRTLEPNINWIGKRFIFQSISAVAVVGSLFMVWTRGVELLDTEFRGGITMTMQTRMAKPGEDPVGSDGRLLLARPEVERIIHQIGEDALGKLTGSVIRSELETSGGAINNPRNEPPHPSDTQEEVNRQEPPQGGAGTSDDHVLRDSTSIDEEMRLRILAELRNASILTVGEMTEAYEASKFQVKVASPKGMADEETITDQIVNAVVKRFEDQLEATPSLTFKGAGDPNHASYTFPIEDNILGINIKQPSRTQSVARYRGGVAIVIDEIQPPVTTDEADRRISRLREQPDFASARDRNVRVIGLDPTDPNNPDQGYASLAVVVHDSTLDLRRVDFERWDSELARVEWNLISTALAESSTLQEISSFSPAVARSLAAAAVVAVTLSLLGMLVYIWVRFGSARYSISAIVALAHDVCICLGAIALTHYLAGTKLGAMLLLDEYRIDLNVIAAFLTIIGYSLNDTIVILDRVRENRGKRLIATPEIINNSINQTFSRTIMTSVTTVGAVLILFILGGTGIQPFAFTFLVGLLTGSYSSVAIAAPLISQRAPQPSGPTDLVPQQ